MILASIWNVQNFQKEKEKEKHAYTWFEQDYKFLGSL